VGLLTLDHLEDLFSLLHLQGQWDPGDLVGPSERKMLFKKSLSSSLLLKYIETDCLLNVINFFPNKGEKI